MNVPMNYVDPPDVPEGMTLEAYRRARSRPVRRRRRTVQLRRRAVAAPVLSPAVPRPDAR